MLLLLLLLTVDDTFTAATPKSVNVPTASINTTITANTDVVVDTFVNDATIHNTTETLLDENVFFKVVDDIFEGKRTTINDMKTLEATDNLQKLYAPTSMGVVAVAATTATATTMIQLPEDGILEPSPMLTDVLLENLNFDNEIYIDTSSRQYLKLPVFRSENNEELFEANAIVSSKKKDDPSSANNIVHDVATSSYHHHHSHHHHHNNVESETEIVMEKNISVHWYVRDSLKYVPLDKSVHTWHSLDNNSNIGVMTFQNQKLYVLFDENKSYFSRTVVKQIRKLNIDNFHMIIATSRGKQIGKNILVIKHNLSSNNLDRVVAILKNAKKNVSFMNSMIESSSDNDKSYDYNNEKSSVLFYSPIDDTILGFKNQYIRNFGIWGKTNLRDRWYVKICCRDHDNRYINCGLAKIGKNYEDLKDLIDFETKIYGSMIVHFTDFKDYFAQQARIYIPKCDIASKSVIDLETTDKICYIDDIAYNHKDYRNYINLL